MTYAQLTDNHKITLFKPLLNSKRINIHIPNNMKVERIAFKQLNTSFYHSNQKLWSLVNTKENEELLKNLFQDKIVIGYLKDKMEGNTLQVAYKPFIEKL